MRIKSFVPTKGAVARRVFFDSLAASFFHQGGEVGCAVLHGFTGTPANVRVVADCLAGAGHTVYAPLLSGHGKTLRDMDDMTEEDWLRDAHAAYDRLREAGCKRIYLMGLSMGGLLAAITAAQRGADGLVLMSTPFMMRQYLHSASRISSLLPFIVYGEDRYQRDSYKQGYAGAPLRKLKDLERLARKARGGLHQIHCPTLILQSANDKRVDMRSVHIAKYGVASEDVTVTVLERSPHGCTFGPERDLVATYCLNFVQKVESRAEGRDTNG